LQHLQEGLAQATAERDAAQQEKSELAAKLEASNAKHKRLHREIAQAKQDMHAARQESESQRSSLLQRMATSNDLFKLASQGSGTHLINGNASSKNASPTQDRDEQHAAKLGSGIDGLIDGSESSSDDESVGEGDIPQEIFSVD